MSPKLRRPAESFNFPKNSQATRLSFGGAAMMSLKLIKFKFSYLAHLARQQGFCLHPARQIAPCAGRIAPN
jgi:hypothetical protein